MDTKYLVLELPKAAFGLDHALSVLKTALIEAVLLDRTFVVCPYVVPRRHNLGYEIATDMDRYISFEKTKVFKISSHGDIREYPFRYIQFKDFDISLLEQAYIRQPSDAPQLCHDSDHKVIIRKEWDNYLGQNHEADSFQVRFEPSDEVNQITDTVLQSLVGIGLDKFKRISSLFEGVDISANRHTDISISFYICFHARVFDQVHYRDMIHISKPSYIRHMFNSMVTKEAPVYIMSDVRNPRYFDFLLKEGYQIYRYYDFPVLEQLVSGENGRLVDNAMLYSVEKNIMQHATIRIMPYRNTNRRHTIYAGIENCLPLNYKYSPAMLPYNLVYPMLWRLPKSFLAGIRPIFTSIMRTIKGYH